MPCQLSPCHLDWHFSMLVVIIITNYESVIVIIIMLNKRKSTGTYSFSLSHLQSLQLALEEQLPDLSPLTCKSTCKLQRLVHLWRNNSFPLLERCIDLIGVGYLMNLVCLYIVTILLVLSIVIVTIIVFFYM